MRKLKRAYPKRTFATVTRLWKGRWDIRVFRNGWMVHRDFADSFDEATAEALAQVARHRKLADDAGFAIAA